MRSLRFSTTSPGRPAWNCPRVAKITDAPPPWVLPTELARAGVEFLFVGVNRVCVPPETPLLFWWEAPTLAPAHHAGGRLRDGQLPPRDIGGFGTGIRPAQRLAPPLLAGHDPHQRQRGTAQKTAVRRTARGSAHGGCPGPPTGWAPLRFFRRDPPRAPGVARGAGPICPDAWIHGIMAAPIESKLARQVRPRIADVQILGTLLEAWGLAAPDLSATVARAL